MRVRQGEKLKTGLKVYFTKCCLLHDINISHDCLCNFNLQVEVKHTQSGRNKAGAEEDTANTRKLKFNLNINEVGSYCQHVLFYSIYLTDIFIHESQKAKCTLLIKIKGLNS